MKETMMLTLCLGEDSILVSRAILEALNSPRQVQILINEERQTLLLQPCGLYDREARVVQEPPMAGNPYYSAGDFEVSGHTLLKRIRRLTGWTDDRPRVIYGKHITSHNVIVFDLKTAQLSRLQMPLDESGGIKS